MTKIFIPTPMRSTTHNKATLEVGPGSVNEVLSRCSHEFPGLRGQLFNENGAIKRYINIFVNGDDIQALDGMNTVLTERDEVLIVPAMAGG